MIILTWNSTEFEVVDEFIIFITSSVDQMGFSYTTRNTSITLASDSLHYNQEYDVSLVARNCAGQSAPTMANIIIGKLIVIIMSMTNSF